MSQQFNPDAFLTATITEPCLKRSPLPTIDYVGVICGIFARNWVGKNDPSLSGVALDVQLELTIPGDLQASLGISRSVIAVKDSIMLDLTQSGAIDTAPDKNRRLGMYRIAADLNKKGEPFSPSALVGKTVLVKIKHEEWNGEIQERVAGVARLA